MSVEAGGPAPRSGSFRGPHGSWSGRSLSYMRHLLRKEGPTSPDVLAFIDEWGHDLVREPQLGMVLLFNNRFHGDIGLYVADERQLRIGTAGSPILLPFHHLTEQHYVGARWWPEEES